MYKYVLSSFSFFLINCLRGSADSAQKYGLGAPPSWEILRDMLFTFKRLMRLDYKAGFTCETCKGDVIVFDGVTFGPPKRYSGAEPTRADTNAPRVQVDRRYILSVEKSDTI